MQKAAKVGRINTGAHRLIGRWAIPILEYFLLLAKTISLSFSVVVLSRPKAPNRGLRAFAQLRPAGDKNRGGQGPPLFRIKIVDSAISR